MLVVTYCESHRRAWFKKLPEVLLRNSDMNDHNNCKTILFGEIMDRDGYFLIKSIDMVGGDEQNY